mmetsp:Transcript_96723/g.144830  ORF Transcript_96723/g.144830 Transcript_96723/m.144830 type:complete len:225 (-) Transcript_96723:1287-1961(-)
MSTSDAFGCAASGLVLAAAQVNFGMVVLCAVITFGVPIGATFFTPVGEAIAGSVLRMVKPPFASKIFSKRPGSLIPKLLAFAGMSRSASWATAPSETATYCSKRFTSVSNIVEASLVSRSMRAASVMRRASFSFIDSSICANVVAMPNPSHSAISIFNAGIWTEFSAILLRKKSTHCASAVKYLATRDENKSIDFEAISPAFSLSSSEEGDWAEPLTALSSASS